jgi:Ca-activated chloride channel family protein
VDNTQRFLCGALALGLAILRGQQPQTAGAPQGSHLVVCYGTVQDKAGHLLTNLPQSVFTVFENDTKQEIQLFKREDAAVSMGLIVDNSGSMRAKRRAAEAATLGLVKDSNPDDEVFVVNFNDEIYLDNPRGKDFMTDREEIQEALTRIDSRGGSAMRDAVDHSIGWMKNAHKDKKILVVITDGIDDASVTSLEDVIRDAQQSGVLIYTIGLLADEEKRIASTARRQLNALTEATGGMAYYPNEVAEVDKSAHQVAHDIRNQYTIGYKPSNNALDGTFRRIKLMVKASGNPIPRTRAGYYATADQEKSATRGKEK